ncbi:MAG: ribonuclease D [Candidatus Pelagadaptatus aseana]|uniref:ribonuclease D n=1 Tax=Candidatus Pelagadaptatus aseana TaxID=3120508 RepID=UPI0039B1BE8A
MAQTENLIATEPVWIDDGAELSRLCDQWCQQAAIAVDTEFMRTTTFFPNAALFQVGDGQGCYLIDPLAIDDLGPFSRLLCDERVTKVMHSCSEDLEVFQSFLGVVPAPVFDTQIAAAFAGLGFSMGYARLVEASLGIEVAKSETRSDWLQRPLSVSQMSYAALDVAYLPVIYGLLVKKLTEQQRLTWVLEECAGVITAAKQEPDPETYYTKIKSAWKLNRQQLACLQMLASWRECEARDRNIPRNRLIKERTLWDMARLRPTEIKDLKRLEGMPPRTINSDGNELLEIIDQAYRLPQEFCPHRLPRPLSPESGDLVKSLKKVQQQFAEDLGVPPEILLRKKDIEFMVRAALEQSCLSFPDNLKGWRQVLMGDALATEINSVIKK